MRYMHGVHGGVQRCVEGVEVHRGMQRSPEVCRSAWRDV